MNFEFYQPDYSDFPEIKISKYPTWTESSSNEYQYFKINPHYNVDLTILEIIFLFCILSNAFSKAELLENYQMQIASKWLFTALSVLAFTQERENYIFMS